MPDKTDGFSVIICCYNSEERLTETLFHLSKQTFTGSWEMIIIDNSSADNTVTVAHQLKTKYFIDREFSIVTEPKSGLNYARLAGVNAAKYEYVLFCDDDNWLDPNYISIAYETMKSDNTIGALGGRCIVAHNNSVILPNWFTRFQNNYAVGLQMPHSGDITFRRYLWGAGLVTRKKLFIECVNERFPFLLTDREKHKLTSGGDTELCLRIIMTGKRLYYDEQLQLHHYIPENRLTETYRDALLNGIDVAHNTLQLYYKLIEIKSYTTLKKAEELTKNIIKIPLALITRKWDLKIELFRLYIFTGINLGVTDDMKMLKKLNDEFAKQAT